MTSPFQLAAARNQQRAPVLPVPVRVRPRVGGGGQPSAAFLSGVQRSQAQRQERKGILGQIKDQVANIIPGVAHLAKTAAVEAAAPVRTAINAIQGDASASDVPALLNPASVAVDSFLGRSNDRTANLHPLASQFGGSMRTTYEDVIHPSRFKRAYDEGQIVAKVLEDAGNVALVGGVAAKGLGAAAKTAEAAGNAERAAMLGRAGNVAQRIATPLDKVADAPMSVPRAVITGGRRALIKGFDSAAEGAFGAGAQERAISLAAKYPGVLTDEGRFLLSASRKAERDARRAQTKTTRVLHQAAEAADVSLDEQGAVTAVRTGIAQQIDNLVRQGVDPEQARQTVVLRDRPEQTLSAGANEIALGYLNRTLPPEVLDRMDRYAGVVDEVIGAQTERALAGQGRPGGPLDPRQLGEDPLWDRVDQALKDAGGKGVDVNTGALIDPADQGLLNDILDSPEVYPAPWRPAMRAASLAREANAAAGGTLTVPVRPSEMNAAGMQQPQYLPGGRSDLVDPTAVGTGRTPIREGIRGVRGVSSEKLRATSEFQPFSARTIAEKAGQEARTTVMNERVVEMFNDPKVRTVADAIPQARRAELYTAAEREARAQRGTPAQIKVRTDELYGKYLHDELRDVYRHDVIMGDRNNPQVGDFDPADKAAYAKITDDSVVLPAGLKDRLIPYMRGKDMGRTFNMLAKINTKFKGLVLPWSVRWQLGDAVGGAFMAWSGGGVNPAKLFGAMRDLRKLDDAGVRAIFDDLQDSGLNMEEAAWMRGDSMLGTPTTKAGKAWRRAGDIRRASFRLNETINRLNRQGYALAKLQDLLTEKGLNLDDVQAGGKWDDPDVQKAIEAAVDDANKVMGTFDEMTPFERNYVRNIFPFWCVDEATEALTQRGWVNGHDIRQGDQVLSMDPVTGQLHWAHVHEVNRKPYSGDMIRLKGRNIDALVTPGHKFVVDHELIPVDDLRQRHTITTMGAPLDGTKTLSDAFVELVGWAVTEGHFRKGRRTVEITQKDGTLTCARIGEVLAASGAKWHTHRSGVRLAIRTFGVSGRMADAIRAAAPNRVMTMDFLVRLSPEQRVNLIGTMISADGHHAQRDRSDVPVFAQKDEAAADAFVTLCAMAGFQTYKRQREMFTFGRHRTVWAVSVRNTDTAAVRHLEGWTQPGAPHPALPPREHYEGIVWCPRTDFGTFVCRRNGIVYVTGNTWNRHITALAWRTAIDNPSRAMWTMNLGRYGAQQNGDAELLPWQEGSLVMGNTLIPTNFINPFNDVAGGSIYTPTGAVRSMSPALKLGFAAVGKDANRGFADITRSYDGKGLDELGRAGGFRLLSPAELAYQAIRQVPQGRGFLNAMPTGEVASVGLGPHPRYGSGEFMVDKAGRPIDTESRWQSLYGLLGMGGTGDYPLLGSLSDNADIIAARDRRRAEAARRAANTIHFKG